jgi:hypothetical protein
VAVSPLTTVKVIGVLGTERYLGVEVEDALELSEQLDL